MATCARPQPAAIDCAALRAAIAGGRSCLLVFGTAWGLAPEAIAGADRVLAPIAGAAGPAAVTYYVSSSRGNDSHAGLSEANAFATLAKVNSLN